MYIQNMQKNIQEEIEMIKCKIINAKNAERFEKDVEEFIANKAIENILYSTSTDDDYYYYSAMILYNERTKQEQNEWEARIAELVREVYPR